MAKKCGTVVRCDYLELARSKANRVNGHLTCDKKAVAINDKNQTINPVLNPPSWSLNYLFINSTRYHLHRKARHASQHGLLGRRLEYCGYMAGGLIFFLLDCNGSLYRAAAIFLNAFLAGLGGGARKGGDRAGVRVLYVYMYTCDIYSSSKLTKK